MWFRVAIYILNILADKKKRAALLSIIIGICAIIVLLLSFIFGTIVAIFGRGGGGMPDDGNFYFPLELYQIPSSHFDPARVHPITGNVEPHNGTDFGAPEGTEIHSSRGGIVTVAGYNQWNGNYVVIDHGEGIETVYKHMFQPAPVMVGQEVNQLEVIGGVGHTGDSAGNHIHIELKVDGVYIDIFPYLQPWPEDMPNGESSPASTGLSATSFVFLPHSPRKLSA